MSAPSNQDSGKSLVWGFAILVAIGVSFFIGRASQIKVENAPSSASPSRIEEAAAADPDVFRAALGRAPVKGPSDALVTIVEFSEFECPFCSRVSPTLQQLEREFSGKIRVAFKHFPLSFHPHAQLAGEASLAAHAQGKFWEYHDKLFANQKAIGKDDLIRYAGELGLNVEKFKADLDSSKWKSWIEDDKKEAEALGVNSTPTFFINGVKMSGAQPYEEFKTRVQAQIAKAEKILKDNKGLAKTALYDRIIRNGQFNTPSGDSGKKEAAAPQPSQPSAPSVVDNSFKSSGGQGGRMTPPPESAGLEYVGDAPWKGARDASIVIQLFSDFQCPFCSRVEPTLTQVLNEYPKDVKVVWRNLPLGFHDRAKPAAIAAHAAGLQGKFWEYHDKLFANQRALGDDDLKRYAQELGLNMDKFNADLSSSMLKDYVDADEKMAGRVGASGTPASFVNGKHVSGAQPFTSFKAAVDAELAEMKKLRDAGKSFDVALKERLEANKKAPDPERPRAPAVEVGCPDVPAHTPTKGPANALVTIVEFSDFQCPFCSRVVPTLKKIQETYGDKVRIAFRHLPLDFHPNAAPAAEAAMAAHAQGKFWQYHDKLFENSAQLSRDKYIELAKELGLNMGRFQGDLDKKTFAAAVSQDKEYAGTVGATGTPAFFINGVKVSGARPFESFKAEIDKQLELADKLIKAGGAKDLYKRACDENKKSAAAAAPAGGGDDPPAAKVEFKPNQFEGSPALGPANAKVTLVVFSDFQCPFCNRGKNTMNEIKKAYAGKVRMIFKHLPLGFHDRAKPAAIAAMAAHRQGKFWEYHDKLFDNQRALSDDDLKRYAQELGLDLGKFSKDIADPKLAEFVDKDTAMAGTVGADGTPTFFVNGERIVGAVPFDNFKTVIDKALKN
ncbi:MAG: hypothetical protein GMKNLPBB_02421 [Myxococcota bacterium]|nr:hypothetical protein [Myxococcota bacterium]